VNQGGRFDPTATTDQTAPHPLWRKPPERRDEPQATTNRRLAEQTRKILRKHYMSKYRVR
jgi:hypothetical protein